MLGDDLLGQAMRCVRGIDVTQDSTSIDAMKQVCLGGPGHYLGSDQTLELMQTEYIYPNGRQPDVARRNGTRPASRCCLTRPSPARTAILAKAGCRVDPEIDAAIRAKYREVFPMIHYGYIGLGNLGAACAGCLVKAGFTVTVYDLNPALADPRCHPRGPVPRRLRPRSITSSPACRRPPCRNGCCATSCRT